MGAIVTRSDVLTILDYFLIINSINYEIKTVIKSVLYEIEFQMPNFKVNWVWWLVVQLSKIMRSEKG